MKPFLLLFAALFLCGCSTPEHYYRLSAEGPAPATGSGFALGVGPITLPDYIDRGELVFQSSETKFEVPYEQRWAGSLRDTTTRVLGTNLARRLGTGNLHTYPWPPGTPLRYQVRIDVRQFHARSGGDAILEASWVIEEGGKEIRRQAVNLREPVTSKGYEGIVAAQSRLLVQFASAIARSFPG
ncbi:MAG: PqiC family protein [Verrucomicrobiota bacterium]